MLDKDTEEIFASLSDPLFALLVQKVAQDHPNIELFSPIFLKEYEKRHNLTDKQFSVIIYSFGKMNVISESITKRTLDLLDKDNMVVSYNIALYALTNKLLDKSRIIKLCEDLKSRLEKTPSHKELKAASKIIFQFQNQGIDHSSLLEVFRKTINRLGFEQDTYFARVFRETDSQTDTMKAQPLSSVKQTTPYTQEKLFSSLKKGGFNVELEPVIGGIRLDLKVEDLCIEVDGMFHASKTEADLHRDKLYRDICDKNGLRYMAVKADVKDEWSSDTLLQILNKLKV